MNKWKGRRLILASALAIASASASAASTLSITGNLTSDDDVDYYNFTLTASSFVTFISFSYGGGTNAAGATFAAGGFDPTLALFDSTGALLESWDGAPVSALINVDGTTGAAFDEWFQVLLEAGDYTVAVAQADNYAGPNLASAFARVGQGNYTPAAFGCAGASFLDVTCSQRTSFYAFDIQDGEFPVAAPVPLPAAAPLFLTGLGLIGWLRRRY